MTRVHAAAMGEGTPKKEEKLNHEEH